MRIVAHDNYLPGCDGILAGGPQSVQHERAISDLPCFCLCQAFFVATIFVLLSVPVSLYEIAMHLENFSRPKLQTRIIRILFMVPIYALDRCMFVLDRCTCFASHEASDGSGLVGCTSK